MGDMLLLDETSQLRTFVRPRCEITVSLGAVTVAGEQQPLRGHAPQEVALPELLVYKVRVLLSADYKPEFDSLRDGLLELAQIRHVDELMRRVVAVLAARPHVALARIWQIDQGDLCATCRMAPRCPDRTHCLHLVASAGAPGSDDRSDWSRVDGEFSRIPLGVGKVGRVGASGEAIVVQDFAEDPSWLRIFADEIAGAIVNARAFEEIERLQAHLELENTYLQEEVREARAFGDIIGQTPAIRQLLRQIELVAPTDASVLILGE